MLLPLGVLSAALEWGAVGRLRAGGACVGAAAKSSESGSGALLLLSKTPKAVVKEEFSPSIKKEVSFFFLEARNAISSGTDNFLDPPVPVLE